MKTPILETEQIYLIGVFFILLLLSAFFSGSETALFSLSQLVIQRMLDEKKKTADLVSRLLKKPQKLLTTILFGNTLVNVLIASLAATIAYNLSHRLGFNEMAGLVIEVAIVTVVILLIGEITPKVFSLRRSEQLSLKVVKPLMVFWYLFTPVTVILTALTNLLTRLLGNRNKAPFVTEEELKTLISMGKDKGTIEHDEERMLESLFSFSDTTVKEIMVPRIDMECVEDTESLDEALKIIKEAGYSRIPVYHETVDHIDKILYAKDLLRYLDRRNGERPSILSLARDAYHIPSTKKIDDLLKEFKREKVHIAIVVDEYGGTAGMVTLEDILEEIVGEIQDEYDEEKPLHTWVAPNILEVSAMIDMEDLSDLVRLELPEEEDFETLGGFIFALTERVPEKNEEIEYKNLKFVITGVEQHRIKDVRIVINPPAENDGESGED